jgi:hypothetical protein
MLHTLSVNGNTCWKPPSFDCDCIGSDAWHMLAASCVRACVWMRAHACICVCVRARMCVCERECVKSGKVVGIAK